MIRTFTTAFVVASLLSAAACSAESAKSSTAKTQAPLGANAAEATTPPAPVAVNFPAPPRIVTTPAELAAAKAAPDFAAARNAAVAAADRLIATPPVLPDGFGSWIFYYACPDDGTSLHTLAPDKHECPRCKKIYSDERTNAAYRCTLHYASEHAAEALAWGYAYTGDDKYAQGVQRILLKYADDYASYPDRLDRWGHSGLFAPLGGRRYVQSLDEGVGAVALTHAYDLTRQSPAWSDAQRKHVEEDFFRATSKSLLRFNQGINNHQTWYNAGLIDIAATLGDNELLNHVLQMQGGVYFQLDKSIGRDGLWYEGSMAYHNYALQPMVEIANTTRRLGMDIYKHSKLKSLITGPLHAAYPDGSVPVINDSDPNNINMFNWAFEWGWKNYKEPFFAQAAAHGDQKRLEEMLGPGAKVDWPLKLKSEALPDAGLAFLREGEGPGATCVVMDYGPHGGGDEGGHGHFDKLSITLFANGKEWLLDPGRLDYSHKEYKTWVKMTAAHNTVGLFGRRQEATTGKLLWMKEGEANGVKWSACAAESSGAYPGSLLRRYLLLTDKILVDVFDVDASAATQIDWFSHATAEKVQPLDGAGTPASESFSPGSDNGYQHLTDGLKWAGAEARPWAYVRGKEQLVVHFVPDAKEQLITVNGIGYNVEQKTPTILRRRNAKTTRFVAVFDLSGDGSVVKSVAAKGEKKAEVSVTAADGVTEIEFAGDGVKVKKRK